MNTKTKFAQPFNFSIQFYNDFSDCNDNCNIFRHLHSINSESEKFLLVQTF